MKRIVRRRRATGVFVTVLVMLWAGAYHIESRQPQRIDLFVSGGRPLAAAIRELENRFEWVITYEDPPYEWAGDIEDATLAVSKVPNPTNRVWVPRLRSFAFSYRDTKDPRPNAMLSAMLRDYNLSGIGAEFRSIVSGPIASERVFHVVPTMSANERGIPTPRQSRLDVPVTLDGSERTGLELIEAVLGQVSAATGLRVAPGTVPINLLVQTKLRLSAENDPARDVLLRALAATGKRVSWRLLCGPDTKTCYFNVHFVPTPGPGIPAR